MRVAVLGSGPSGLMAAHVCAEAGHEVTIFSKTREPSPLNGAQYLHVPIPGLTNDQPDGLVRFHKVGTAEGYAKKVYGDPFAPTSWALFPEGDRPMWSTANVYEKLHRDWYEKINTVTIDDKWLDYLEERRDMFAFVISAIPCPVICKNPEHQFPYATVTFESHDYRDANMGEHYIYYSGSETDLWYRSSHVGGLGWYEYGDGQAPGSFKDGTERVFWRGRKPLDTDCNCRPRILRVGRFGEWKKGILLHNAFFKTLDGLEVTERALA